MRRASSKPSVKTSRLTPASSRYAVAEKARNVSITTVGPEAAAAPVARAEARVQGALHGCRGGWCEVTLQGLRGWMRRSHLWGVYADETPR